MKRLENSEVKLNSIVSTESVAKKLEQLYDRLLDAYVEWKDLPRQMEVYQEWASIQGYHPFDQAEMMTDEDFKSTCPDKEDPVKVESWKTNYTNYFLERQKRKTSYEEPAELQFIQDAIHELQELDDE